MKTNNNLMKILANGITMLTFSAATMLAIGCPDPEMTAPPEEGEGCALVGTSWSAHANTVYLNDPADDTVQPAPAGNPVHVSFIGIDPVMSNLLLALTFDDVITYGNSELEATDLPGGIDSYTGDGDHAGFFRGHCQVYDAQQGHLLCEIDDPMTEPIPGFLLIVDDIENPSSMVADNAYFAFATNSVYFMDDAVSALLTFTADAAFEPVFVGLTEADVEAIGGAAEFDLGC